MNSYVSSKRGKTASVKRALGFLLLFGLAAGSAFAAELPKVRAAASPTQVTLGGEFQLAVDIDRPEGFTVDPLKRDVVLAPFEVRNFRNETVSRGGQTVERYVFTLAAFELGDLLVPAVTVQFRDASGRVYQRFTEPVPVKIVGVKKRVSDKDDIRTIKPPVSPNIVLIWTLLGGVFILFLLTLLAIHIVYRKSRLDYDPDSLKEPDERAEIEWKRLSSRSLLAEGKAKEFYSELSLILKRYLDRRYGAETLELTTEEVLQLARQLELPPDVVQKIRHVLENSDLVKFARQVPDQAFGEALAREILEVAHRTKPEEEAEEEKGRRK